MGPYKTINFDCLRNAMEIYEENCGKLTEFGLQYVRVFVNLCESQFAFTFDNMIPQLCTAL